MNRKCILKNGMLEKIETKDPTKPEIIELFDNCDRLALSRNGEESTKLADKIKDEFGHRAIGIETIKTLSKWCDTSSSWQKSSDWAQKISIQLFKLVIPRLTNPGANSLRDDYSARCSVIVEGIENTLEDDGDDIDELEIEFPEGKELYRIHRQRERNAKLVDLKKQSAASLVCEVCKFDFSDMYGKHGEGYIECHHTIPVSTYEPGQKTKLSDLALVCANCHRMLHRQRPWLTMDNLKQILADDK